MSKHAIQITIVDGGSGQECDVNCGLDWSSAETVVLVRQRIEERFGDKVQLEYLDPSESTTNRYGDEFKRLINKGTLSLPLLLINGKLRVSGQFDIRMLLDAIEVEMEIALL